MNELFESMDIDKEQKVALTEAFEAAVLKKTTEMLDEHVEALLNEKAEALEEEYAQKVTLLEDSLDGYLDTVVEEFIAENAPIYEAQIKDEKAQTLLEMFDNMLKVAGVEMLTIQEGKEVLDEAELEKSDAVQVEKLTEKVAEMADRLVEAKREADKFLKDGIIAEMKVGLSMLEGEKFEKLAEMASFERSKAYLTKLETIKESIIDSRSEDFDSEAQFGKGANLPQGAFKQPEPVSAKDAMDYSRYI